MENEYARSGNVLTDLQIAGLTVIALVAGKRRIRALLAAFPAWKSALLYEIGS